MLHERAARFNGVCIYALVSVMDQKSVNREDSRSAPTSDVIGASGSTRDREEPAQSDVRSAFRAVNCCGVRISFYVRASSCPVAIPTQLLAAGPTSRPCSGSRPHERPAIKWRAWPAFLGPPEYAIRAAASLVGR